MLPYILVALYLLILAIHFDIKGHTRKKNLYIKITIWVLILFSGLRNELGIDTFAYAYAYESTPQLSDVVLGKVDWLNVSTQPLWYMFTILCKTISNHFVFVQMIIAIFFNYLMVRFLKNVTNKVFTFLLVFFCTKWYGYNFEILRESICVVLILNGVVDYFKTKNTIRFLLFCLPAVFIHWFAAFALILFGIVYKSNWLVILWSSAILTFLLLFMSNSELNFFLNSILLNFDSSESKLNSYLNEMHEGSFNMYFYLQLSITCFVPVIILIKYYYREINYTSKITFVLIKYLPLLLIIGASSSHLIIAYRLSNYIYPIFLVLAVNTLYDVYLNKRFRNKVRGAGTILIFLFCFIINIYMDVNTFLSPLKSYQDNGSLDIRYFPYTTVFQEPNKERSYYYSNWRNWQ